MLPALAMWMPGTQELIIILIIGLILFGGRLPEVGKSIGKSIIEFRKGLRGLKDDVGLGDLDEIKRDLRGATRSLYEDTEPTGYYEEPAGDDETGIQDAEVVTEGPAPDEEATRHEAAEDDVDPADAEPKDEGEKPQPFGYRR